MKKISIVITILLILGSFTFLSAEKSQPCHEIGIPYLNCPIWKVIYSPDEGITCFTGGSWKC